jgi:hypothetical protein
LLEIVDDAVRYAPSNEVELGDRRRVAHELYAGCSTKGIEQLLGIAIQTRFVGHVNREHLSVRRGIRDVLSFSEIRNEPFQPPERRRRLGSTLAEDAIELMMILIIAIEPLQTLKKNSRFRH